MKITLIYYRALDHFTTNSSEEFQCIQEGVGIFESETDKYITLKTLDADINMKNSEKEYNNILKSALIYKKAVEVEVADLE